jgi:HPt (histidine-containing phosphotransfer) domain-containing protein
MSDNGGNKKNSDFCNIEYLLVNLGRNQTAAERLIHVFLDSAPALCQRLEEAAKRSDLVVLKDVLHDIRSICVLFSGHRCLDQARNIEDAIRDHESPSQGGKSSPDWHSMCAPLVLGVQCMADELKGYLVDQKR